MRLSIITINLNNLEGLKRTFESIVEQTCRDFEWIVVDGDSTDGSREYMEQNKQYTSHYISEKDTGIYNAMNKGIRMAKGEYLLFLNSGDWLYDRDTLAYAAIELKDADVVFGHIVNQYPFRSEIQTEPTMATPIGLLHHDIPHQATFYKREILAESKYDEDYTIAADWAKNWQLIFLGKKYKHINNTIANYDKTGYSSTHYDVFIEERNRAIDQYTPIQVRPDIDQYLHFEEKWGYLSRRKSLRWLTSFFHKTSCRLDRLLSRFEK